MSTASLSLVASSPPLETASDAVLLESLCPAVTAATWAGLLNSYGGLRGLVTTPDTALARDLSPVALVALRSAFRLTERFASSKDSRAALSTPQRIYEYVRPHLAHLPMERFLVLAFNARSRLLRMETVSEGSTDQCAVDPRKVFAMPIATQATAIVLCHNHPAGDPEPSTQDVAITKQLREAGQLLCIRLLDHIVVGSDTYVSLDARGLLRGTWGGERRS